MRENLVPLIYLISISIIAAGLYWMKVPNEMIGMIVGAGLTRVKISTPNGPKEEVKKPGDQ